MSDVLQRAVRSAVLRVLGPVVSLLLDAGLGVGEMTSLVKVAYVRAAIERGRARGGHGRPSVSRLAVVTGLTRTEVASILASGEADSPALHHGRQRAERVLAGWWTDPDFLTSRGEPEVLRVRGGRRSFAALCRRYSGEQRAAPVLEELLLVRAVRELPDGRVQAVSRTCATVKYDPEGIEALGEQVRNVAHTLVTNMHHPTRPRFAREVANARLEPRYAPMLIRDIEESLRVKAEYIHETLNDPLHTAKSGEPAVRLGVGMYLFEEPFDTEESSFDGVLPNPPPQKPAAGRARRRKR